MTSDSGGAPDCEIMTAPFTHTLSEATTLPTFAMHIEEQFTTNPVYVDLLGCVVKSFELTYETGSDTPAVLAVDLIVQKVIDNISGAATTLTTPDPLALERFTWGHVSTLSLTYNSLEIETMKTYCKKHTFKLINDVNAANIFGDDYPNRVDAGHRSYELTFTVMVRNRTWLNLARLKCPSFTAQYNSSGFYLTAIAYNSIIGRSATDYINIALSKLHLIPEDIEEEIPSWDTDQGKEWKDIMFHGAPGNVLTASIMDALSAAYYERGGA
jgi:hypothetical protein